MDHTSWTGLAANGLLDWTRCPFAVLAARPHQLDWTLRMDCEWTLRMDCEWTTLRIEGDSWQIGGGVTRASASPLR